DAAGCERLPWSADTRCCGFGGLFSFKLPEVAEAMADDKLASLAEGDAEAQFVVGADGSCLMHLRARAEHEGRPIVTRHIAEVVAAVGCTVVETDLGEWIIQLAGHTPSHIIAPAVHLDRHQIRDILQEEVTDARTLEPEPERLAAFAREQLRARFLAADLGVS